MIKVSKQEFSNAAETVILNFFGPFGRFLQVSGQFKTWFMLKFIELLCLIEVSKDVCSNIEKYAVLSVFSRWDPFPQVFA